MKKSFLIHTSHIGGHQLEYIHHLYIYAINKLDDYFVFLVPPRFRKDSVNLVWPSLPNVRVIVLDENDIPSSGDSLLKMSFITSRTLKKFSREFSSTDIVLISIVESLPFLPLMINSKIRVTGIVYRIYLYDWKDETIFKRMQDVLKYIIFSKFKIYSKVFILQDKASSVYLNKLYKTDKFHYLPDPISDIVKYKGLNIHEKLKISSGKEIYLHPGGMQPYKGTLEIMKAIDGMTHEQCLNKVFIFAGQITNEIRDEFNSYFDRLKKKANLIKIDGFISFEELSDLFETCDYVLIPYKVKSQSSGIVGHSAYHNKPVVGIKGGVIGKTIRKWNLGYLLGNSSPEDIRKFLLEDKKHLSKGKDYIRDHSVSVFSNIIFD